MAEVNNGAKLCGWLPNTPDDRDWSYDAIAKATFAPASVDLISYLDRILFQGPYPSCVGFAVMHQIMIEEKIHGLRGSVPSASYIWAMARIQEQEELEITGTHPRLAYKGINRLGCPSDRYWPYLKSTMTIMPNDLARRYAMGRYGLQYYWITYNKSERIRQALAEGHPVTIGTRVTDDIYNYKTGDIVHAPSDSDAIYGGHYMLIVGYENDHFTVVNSWIDSPIMTFHEDMIEWYLSNDFCVITGWNDLELA